MKRIISISIVLALFLALSFLASKAPAQGPASPRVIKLFDETLIEHTTGPVMPDPIVKKTTSKKITFSAGEIAILSSTPDGTGIPNVDDQIAINGQVVQFGEYIPKAVFLATGIDLGGDAEFGTCIDGTSVNACSFPRPHHHPVDVSEVIPKGKTTVTVDLLDFGGAFGNTELYLVIFPQSSLAPRP